MHTRTIGLTLTLTDQVQHIHVRPKRLRQVRRDERLPELLGPNNLLRGLVGLLTLTLAFLS